MRAVRLVLGSILLALILLASVGLVLARNGLSARTALTPAEDRALYELRKLAVAFNSGDRQNPQAGRWRDAAHHFSEECAVCHGPAGRGDGMLGPLVYPPAPDLTNARTQSLSDAELHHIIAQGIRFTAMPGMAGHDSDEEIWQLVSLVRQLPNLSPEQMKQAAGQEAAGESHSHPPQR